MLGSITDKKKLARDFKRKYSTTTEQSPWVTYSCLSQWIFSTVTPIMEISTKVQLEQDMIYQLPEENKTVNCLKYLENNWNDQLTENCDNIKQTAFSIKKPDQLPKCIWQSYRSQYIPFFCLYLLYSTLTYLNTMCLYYFIDALKNPVKGNMQMDYIKMGVLLCILVPNKIAISLLRRRTEFRQMINSQEIRNCLIALITKKLLKKSIDREKQFNMGQMSNQMSADTSNFNCFFSRVSTLLMFPIMFGQGIIIMAYLSGWAVLPALLVSIFFIWFNAKVSNSFFQIDKALMKESDKKLKVINECYNNIRYVKLTATENYFLDRICKLKGTEQEYRKKIFYRMAVLISSNNVAPYLFTIVLIIFTALAKGPEYVTIQTIFTSLSAYGNFSQALSDFPENVAEYLKARVSGLRLNEFLISEEINSDYIRWDKSTNVINIKDNSENAIEIKNGNFFWVDPCKKLFLDFKEQEEVQKKNEKKNWFGKKIITVESGNEFQTNPLSSRIFTKRENNLPNFNISNLNLTIKKGQCVAFIGNIGSGKSSILKCLFGDMYDINQNGVVNYDLDLPHPSINLKGKISYVSQNTWISSLTVKENILFNTPYNEQRYKDALYYACLTDDLDTLSNKDDTMLGDKGVNLSGGQKVRLSLARSIYNNADIYLLDDPISALDVGVGKFIIEEMLLTYLKDKTRVMVTHAVQFLPYFDYIYIVDDGKIVKEGDYHYIKKTKEYEEISKVLNQNKTKNEESKEMKKVLELEKRKSDRFILKKTLSRMSSERKIKEDFETDDEIIFEDPENNSFEQNKQKNDIVICNNKNLNIEKEQLITNIRKTSEKNIVTQNNQISSIIKAEDKKEGLVSLNLVLRYFRLGNIPNILIIYTVLLLIYVGLKTGLSQFLQHGISKNESANSMNDIIMFVQIYISIASFETIILYVMSMCVYINSLFGTNKLNFSMNFKLLHTSINEFWDRVPLGRVINRFSNDEKEISGTLPQIIIQNFQQLSLTIVTFTLVSFGSSQLLWIIIGIYFLVVLYYQRYTMNAWREVTRIQSASSSPIAQIFREILNGTSTIRMFEKEKEVMGVYYTALDTQLRNDLTFFSVRSWYFVRCEILSLLVVVPSIYLSIYFEIKVGLFAVMMQSLLGMTGSIWRLMRQISMCENMFISFERCAFFVDLEPEKGYHNISEIEERYNNKLPIVGYRSKEASSEWMKKGNVQFKNFSCSYRPELLPALKNINLNIKAGTRVGIVGRTGAGKTTFMNSIYRFFENYEGGIFIDGHEIKEQDLKVLRTKLTVISQDPHLFDDSLKGNLDPNSLHKDEDIKNILKDFGIWEKFETQNGLDFVIEENGRNQSKGEKQLLIMARAILNKNKLILLDEATASIDIKTEDLIQKAIEKSFNDSTLFIIAHRLNTIMFCDKILALDKGKVVEYGDTKKLINNEKSYFGKMIQQASDIEEALG